MLEVALRHRFAGGFALEAAFSAPSPGVTALFGPSGCGKTTVLSAVAGLLRPREGRIAFHGATVLDTGAGVFVAPERRRFAVVFQEARLFPHMSVTANLAYGARRAPPDAPGPQPEEIVALLGIGHLLGRRPRALSGGERQRVALGRALLARPRLLLMDEPLAALDAARKAEVLPFLARLHDVARVPILYVTHALDEVDALADTLVLMERGRVLAAGPVEEIAGRTDLPLAARRDAGVILVATVAGHEPERGVTRIAVPGAELLVPLRSEAPGAAVRLRLRARDVAISVSRPSGLSIHNILPCVLAAVAPAPNPGEVFLRLDLGGTLLLARVMRGTPGSLELRPGMALHALVKATAFDAPGSPSW